MEMYLQMTCRHSQQVYFLGDNISFAIRENHDSIFPIKLM